jgi:hypothetical protein
MSNHQVLASLYGGLVGYDAVSWYAYAVQTGTVALKPPTTTAFSRLATIQASNGPPTSTGPVAGTQKNAAPNSKPRIRPRKRPASPNTLCGLPRCSTVANDLLVGVIILPHN